jgi:hypothetical protein
LQGTARFIANQVNAESFAKRGIAADGQLHRVETVTHADTARFAFSLGACQRIRQRAENGVGAEVPALVRREVDAGRVRRPCMDSVSWKLFDVDAGAVGKASSRRRPLPRRAQPLSVRSFSSA